MKMIHPLIATLLIATLAACCSKSRSDLPIPDQVTAHQLDSRMAELKSERDALLQRLRQQQLADAEKIAELYRDRDELSNLKSEAAQEIARLQKLLEEGALPGAERPALEQRLQKSEREVTELNQKLEENFKEMSRILTLLDKMSQETRSLKQEILELNERIEKLQSELTAARTQTQGGESIEIKTADGKVASGNETTSSTVLQESKPTSENQRQPSEKAWQFYVKQADQTEICWEFASTMPQAALLGLRCIQPAPVRQAFKLENFDKGSLLVDQRTGLCVGLDPSASSLASARVLLSACKSEGQAVDLWNFVEFDTEGDTFKLRNLKTGQCLTLGADRRIAQSACATAVSFLSKERL